MPDPPGPPPSESPSDSPPSGPLSRAGRSREPLLLLLFAAAFLLWRGASMAGAHSESYDDEFHLAHGVAYFRGTLDQLPQTEPPLGEALTALPVVLTNTNPHWTGTLYDHSWAPESVLLLVALWRSLLFLPAVVVAFLWCRRAYGTPAGVLAAGLLLFDPNLAAHIPLAAIDALGVVAALVGSFLVWRAFETPTWGRSFAAAIGMAACILVKHTTIVLPLIAVLYAPLFGWVHPSRTRRIGTWPRRIAAGFGFGAVVLLSLWTLLLFDVSTPDRPAEWQQAPTALSRLIDRPLPGGIYVSALVRAGWHAEQGHLSYLLVELSRSGWWYYFPVVLAYKMPLGVALLLVLALLSLRRVRPGFEEWGLLIPLVVWTTLFLTTRVNIGIRHFLPAYAFLLLLASRALIAGAPRWQRALAWVGLGLTALHGLAWHPDYIAYLNAPRSRAFMDISDSNVDWGQGLKQARDWIDRHPQPPGRPIYLLYFGDRNSPRRVQHYLGDRVTLLEPRAPLPDRGLLIASPVWVAGPFDIGDRYAALRDRTPSDAIGRTLLVYDLGP
jgi:hypothetical protein